MALLSSALESATRSRDQLAQARQARVQTAVVQGPRPVERRPGLRKWLVATAALVVLGTALSHHATPPPSEAALPPIPSVPLERVHLDRFQPSLTVVPLVRDAALAPAPQGTVILARQLLDGAEAQAHFLALTVAVEGVRTQPYWDAAGLNIGMGYNVTRRVAEEGVARVTQDFQHAGLDDTTIATLLGKDRHAQARVRLTETQAVALLREIAPDYQARARAFVGAAVFDHLRANEQDALSYLAYNAGKNLDQFNQLRQAVIRGQTQQALPHLTPRYRDAQGHLVANTRAGAYLAAAFWSERGLTQAVRNAEQFEAQVSAGRDAVAITDPAPRRATLGERLGKTAPKATPVATPPSPRLSRPLR